MVKELAGVCWHGFFPFKSAGETGDSRCCFNDRFFMPWNYRGLPS